LLALEGFKSLDNAREWVKEFFNWYNNEHRHSRIKFVTPNQRRTGLDVEILAKRKVLYQRKKEMNVQNDDLKQREIGSLKVLWSLIQSSINRLLWIRATTILKNVAIVYMFLSKMENK